MEILNGLSTLHLALAILSAFLIGLSKSGIKGLGLVMVPIMAMVFGAKPSTGIVLPMLIMADVMAVIWYRRRVKWTYVWKLLPWAVGGIVIGLLTGEWIEDRYFKWLLGAIIIGMLILLVVKDMGKDGEKKKIPDHTLFAGSMGMTGGFATMVGNAAGPVFSVYLLAMRLPKKEFIGTGAWFFFIINLSKVPLHFFFWETINRQTLTINLVLFPAIFLGMAVGLWLVKLFPEKVYRYFVIVMTFIAAMIMLLG